MSANLLDDEQMENAIGEQCPTAYRKYGAWFYAPIHSGYAQHFNPLTDLNAIQAAVMSLQSNIRDLYNANLCEAVCAKFDYSEISEMDEAINATARERCEAFLKTIA